MLVPTSVYYLHTMQDVKIYRAALQLGLTLSLSPLSYPQSGLGRRQGDRETNSAGRIDCCSPFGTHISRLGGVMVIVGCTKVPGLLGQVPPGTSWPCALPSVLQGLRRLGNPSWMSPDSKNPLEV